jgi:hypothetical protein
MTDYVYIIVDNPTSPLGPLTLVKARIRSETKRYIHIDYTPHIAKRRFELPDERVHNFIYFARRSLAKLNRERLIAIKEAEAEHAALIDMIEDEATEEQLRSKGFIVGEEDGN